MHKCLSGTNLLMSDHDFCLLQSLGATFITDRNTAAVLTEKFFEKRISSLENHLSAYFSKVYTIARPATAGTLPLMIAFANDDRPTLIVLDPPDITDFRQKWCSEAQIVFKRRYTINYPEIVPRFVVLTTTTESSAAVAAAVVAAAARGEPAPHVIDVTGVHFSQVVGPYGLGAFFAAISFGTDFMVDKCPPPLPAPLPPAPENLEEQADDVLMELATHMMFIQSQNS